MLVRRGTFYNVVLVVAHMPSFYYLGGKKISPRETPQEGIAGLQ